MSDRSRQARRAVRKAVANRDAARRKLLAQRRKLARKRRRNRESTGAESGPNGSGSEDAGAGSGPHSTVPETDSNGRAAAGGPGSTVPERPARSSVTPRRRLYGLRLHRATRTEGGEDDG